MATPADTQVSLDPADSKVQDTATGGAQVPYDPSDPAAQSSVQPEKSNDAIAADADAVPPTTTTSEDAGNDFTMVDFALGPGDATLQVETPAESEIGE